MGIYSNYRFTLDIQKKNSQASIPVVYKDTGRHFYITLKDGGIPFAVPDECTVFIVINKPRGNPLVNSCIIENSIVHYEFNDLTANQEGVHKCELRLYDSDKRLITSPSFTMIVDERVVYDDEIATKEDVERLNALGVIASEGERQKAEAARVEAEEARAAAEAARVEAENGREAKIAAKEDKADANALRVRVSDLEVGKEDKVDADIVRKRVTNLEARLSDDMFITNSEVAYERAVPAPVAPYAEVNKIGGMTRVVGSKNILDTSEKDVFDYSRDRFYDESGRTFGNDVIFMNDDGSITFSGVPDGSAYSQIVDINMPITFTGKHTIQIYRDTSPGYDDPQNWGVIITLLNCYGYIDDYIGDWGSGKAYTVTGDGTQSHIVASIFFNGNYDSLVQWGEAELPYVTPLNMRFKIMLNEGETALPWESPNKKELLSTPVTKLESMGKNILDISKGLNDNFKDNGDGTYTVTKNANTWEGRVSANIPIYIPANTPFVTYATNVTKNSTKYAAIIFRDDNNQTLADVNFNENPYTRTATSDITNAIIYAQSDESVGAYITIKEIQVELGSKRTDYAPYTADPIDTFEIPEEVQTLKGYGEGVSGDYSNRIVFNEDGTVHYRTEVYDFVYDKANGVPKKATAISGQSTYRYYLNAPAHADLSKRKVLSNTHNANLGLSACDKLNYVFYGTDAAGYYLDSGSVALYIKSPYATEQETADWLDGTVFKLALAKPEDTDITELMPKDNFIKVQSNGRIVAVNEHSQAAPTTITYQKEG